MILALRRRSPRNFFCEDLYSVHHLRHLCSPPEGRLRPNYPEPRSCIHQREDGLVRRAAAQHTHIGRGARNRGCCETASPPKARPPTRPFSPQYPALYMALQRDERFAQSCRRASICCVATKRSRSAQYPATPHNRPRLLLLLGAL